jgi:hypothetical protein
MDTTVIKQEPPEEQEIFQDHHVLVKEEPLDDDTDFHQALIPNVVVKEETADKVAAVANHIPEVDEEPKENLSCPKCDITYYSAMSIKNHIQVCKKVKFNPYPAQESAGEVDKSSLRLVVRGVRKLTDDERRSIRILEQSCFVNDHCKDNLDDYKHEDDIKDGYFCLECDETCETSKKFARHLYAHTFIKKEERDMPCICTSCGQDFPDRDRLEVHLIPDLNCCSGESRVLFPCNLCQKVFTRKDNLRDDLRSHVCLERRAIKKRQYKCKVCSKQYGGQTMLHIHLLSHSSKNKSGSGNKRTSTRTSPRKTAPPKKRIRKEKPRPHHHEVKIEPDLDISIKEEPL